MPLLGQGPFYALNVEHSRRLRGLGDFDVHAMSDRWWHLDANDYACEAPEHMPAGSCLDGLLGAEQRTVTRE